MLLLALLAFGFPAQECGATRITSPACGSASCGHSSEGGARQRPSPGRRAKPSSKQRTAARLCMDLYTHSATLLSRSLSFVANHPPPQPPPDSPLNVALLCLPCLLLSSSRSLRARARCPVYWGHCGSFLPELRLTYHRHTPTDFGKRWGGADGPRCTFGGGILGPRNALWPSAAPSAPPGGRGQAGWAGGMCL